MIPRRIVVKFLLVLLSVLPAACSFLDGTILPEDVSRRAHQAGTSIVRVVTESAPLRATSAVVAETLVVKGKTQAPPVMTAVAELFEQPAAVGAAPEGEVISLKNPYKGYAPQAKCGYASFNCGGVNAAHTGVDSRADTGVKIVAVGPGIVARIQPMKNGCQFDGGDCGMGNTVILEHWLADGRHVYSLYANLDSISADLEPGKCVARGTVLGKMGASGFGERGYWGERRLHLEFKTAPVLGDPRSAAENPEALPEGLHFGWLQDSSDPNPEHWGYLSPAALLGKTGAVDCAQVAGK